MKNKSEISHPIVNGVSKSKFTKLKNSKQRNLVLIFLFWIYLGFKV